MHAMSKVERFSQQHSATAGGASGASGASGGGTSGQHPPPQSRGQVSAPHGQQTASHPPPTQQPQLHPSQQSHYSEQHSSSATSTSTPASPTSSSAATGPVRSAPGQSADVEAPSSRLADVVSALSGSFDVAGSSVRLPAVRVLPAVRRPAAYVSDPLYYPNLLRAGVVAGDAMQYVAYYQHVMAQDTLDKWRDEVGARDRERDRAWTEADRHTPHYPAAHITYEQMQHALGGKQAISQLSFVTL